MTFDEVCSRLQTTASCRCSEWPGHLQNLDSPGLYAWWVDREGATFISERLREPVASGIVYAGQAGAAPSEATLRSRIGGNHIGGRIRNSTFRLTAAAILLEELNNHIEGDRKIDPSGERIIANWLASHFRLTIAPFTDRMLLTELEDHILARLDPPLNLERMPPTKLRSRLRDRRKILYQSGESARQKPIGIAEHIHPNAVSFDSGKTTLHEEIAEILRKNDNQWLSTSEIAQFVNQRGHYRKKNMTSVTAYQIHGRTRNYSHMFERDGSNVRLLPHAI